MEIEMLDAHALKRLISFYEIATFWWEDIGHGNFLTPVSQ